MNKKGILLALPIGVAMAIIWSVLFVNVLESFAGIGVGCGFGVAFMLCFSLIFSHVFSKKEDQSK